MSFAFSPTDPREIVIIGGGAIGCSVGYFLTRHPHFNPKIHSVVILEASEIAGGASGKAGGLVADWATPQCLAPLSFKLHGELAEKHGGHQRWGYRRVYCAEVDLQAQEHTANKPPPSEDSPDYPPELDWLQPASVKSYTEIGTPRNSAQVHPYLYTTSLARLAEEAGAIIRLGRATAINYTADQKAVSSVTFIPKDSTTSETTTTITATDAILAAGPWTPTLLPRAALLTPRGHSIVVKPTGSISPYVLFPTIAPPPPNASPDNNNNYPSVSPEIYPRPADALFSTDTIYSASGDDYDVPLPASTASVAVDERRCADLWTALRGVVAGDRIDQGGSVVVRQQACYKPQIRRHDDGEEVGPMVGAVPGVRGYWLATGHDEWGVSNAAGTGLVVSEMVFEEGGKAKSADCEALDPRHFLLKGEDEA